MSERSRKLSTTFREIAEGLGEMDQAGHQLSAELAMAMTKVEEEFLFKALKFYDEKLHDKLFDIIKVKNDSKTAMEIVEKAGLYIKKYIGRDDMELWHHDHFIAGANISVDMDIEGGKISVNADIYLEEKKPA